MKKRSTLKDVAGLAQVSLSSASRILRNPDKFDPSTVNRVRHAAEELNYVPNMTAGALSSRKSNTIGVLMPSPLYSAFGGNLLAIQQICSQRNYSCKLEFTHFSPERERIALRRFDEQRVEGMLLVGIDPSNIDYLARLEKNGVKYIMLWEKTEGVSNYIAVDNVRSTLQGLQYLYDLGHRRIAYMIGPHACAIRTRERYDTYRSFLERHGIPFEESLIRSQPPSFFMGKEAMRYFLQLEKLPTAIFCVNDYLAIGAMRAIHDAGLSVPENISVCGFDDIETSAYLCPALTSIRTPFYEMGKMAATLLLDSLENSDSLDVQFLMDTALVVRGTCATV